MATRTKKRPKLPTHPQYNEVIVKDGVSFYLHNFESEQQQDDAQQQEQDGQYDDWSLLIDFAKDNSDIIGSINIAADNTSVMLVCPNKARYDVIDKNRPVLVIVGGDFETIGYNYFQVAYERHFTEKHDKL